MQIRTVLALISLVLLAACGGSSGGSQLVTTASGTTGNYQIINLQTGAVEAAAAVPDLLTDNRYRSTHMVFRLIPRGSATLGAAPDSFAAQMDESQHQVDMPKYYAAVFEITQAQWQLLTNTQPWLDLAWSSTSAPVNTVGDTLPAYGLSADLVDAALADWHGRMTPRFALPTDDQWEYASRAGSASLYHWGDSRQTSIVDDYAMVYETGADQEGPVAVGSQQPNAFGLYDTHGNCWELTSNGNLRGGSWNDPVSLARAANRNAIDPDTPHALVGARLLYLP